jgi:hypothetical protein
MPLLGGSIERLQQMFHVAVGMRREAKIQAQIKRLSIVRDQRYSLQML